MTLAELIVLVALITVLGGAAAPNLASLLGSIRLPLAAHQLAADLTAARATAVLRNTGARVTFTDHAYAVEYDLGTPRAVGARLPAGVRVARLPVSGEIRFYPSGRADNATVVLAGARDARRSVVVNQRGRVGVQ
jgi:Tfp pilus assembly protein FimT